MPRFGDVLLFFVLIKNCMFVRLKLLTLSCKGANKDFTTTNDADPLQTYPGHVELKGLNNVETA